MTPGTRVPRIFEGIQAITVDLDDTLWPVAPVLIAAEQRLTEWLRPRAPRTAECPPMAARIRELKASFPEHAHDVSWLRLQYLRQNLQMNGEDPRLAEPAFECFYHARQQVQPYPEVEAVLALWSKHYRLAVISNGNADVRRTPLGKYFSVALNAHEFGAAKPDPAIFLAACEALDVPPAATLHIGDDWRFDVEPARGLGMQVAWMRRPDLDSLFETIPSKISGLSSVVFQDLWEVCNALQCQRGWS